MDLFKYLFSIFFDQRGEEVEGDGGDGQGQPPDDGQGGAPDGQLPGDGEGQGDETPAPPKYGDFGDNPTPDQIYEEYQRVNQDHQGLREKTTRTEQSLAKLRKIVEAQGLQVLTDSQGNPQIVAREKPSSSQSDSPRFTKEHEELFEAPVLNAIRSLVEDITSKTIKDYDSSRFTEKDQQWTGMTKFQATKASANARMIKLYPQLSASEKSHDKQFYDTATMIWEERYKNDPAGELKAATEAAAELGIAPAVVMRARKEGYQQGAQQKTVLGPVGSQSGKSGGFRKLSEDEYFKLSPVDRDKYDKQSVGLK